MAHRFSWLIAIAAVGCGTEPVRPSAPTMPRGQIVDASRDAGVLTVLTAPTPPPPPAAPPVSKAPVVQLALGGSHTCARHEDGAVSCWGANDSGQVGDGTDTDRMSPVRVDKLPPVTAIAADGSRTCATDRDGAVWCWGASRLNRMLDLDEKDPRAHVTTPTRVDGLVAVSQLSGSCAIVKDGRVMCWAELDDVQAVPDLTDATFIVGSRSNGCAAVRATGKVMCWRHGTKPTAVAVTNAVAVGIGAGFGCARLRDGGVSCWGINSQGQLGRGHLTRTPITMRPTPPKTFTAARVPKVKDVDEIAVGGAHVCVRDKAGGVRCWGSRPGDIFSRDAQLTAAAAPVVAVRHVAAGSSHTCTLDGAVKCWGDNRNGQLGIGWALEHPRPTAVPGIADATSVVAGNGISCARRSDGTVACWGHRDPNPRTIAKLTDVVQLTGNSTEPLARTAAGQVFVIGRDGIKEVKLPAAAVDIASGLAFSCAALATGKVACWGQNRWDEFGDGGKTAESERVGVIGGGGIEDAILVGAGSFHACAVRRGGALACWGDALDDDTLGLTGGTPVARTITDARHVTSGTGFVCVLQVVGTVLCWGGNERGELGDGTAERRAAPVRVLDISDAVQLTSASETSCVRRKTGTVACWGRGAEGQLGVDDDVWRAPGDPARAGRSRPIELPGLADVIDVSQGGSHACAVLRDGSVQCWGEAGRGQVGTYASAGTDAPVPVAW